MIKTFKLNGSLALRGKKDLVVVFVSLFVVYSIDIIILKVIVRGVM